MFTQDNSGYFLAPSYTYFCDSHPFLDLAILGIIVPLVVWLVYYIGVYRWSWAPFKGSVRTVFYFVLLMLTLAVGIGSFLTVRNYCSPENLLCDENGNDGATVIANYQSNYKVDYEGAVQALMQQQGIVVADIQLYLTLNNLIYLLVVTAISAFLFRFGSVHARYSPF